ncbi:hypothetical protein NKH73_31070 [Mesorhizobium sp. M0938]|uniref:hypothetical protein n=1 Tax=unclassified Mesorhizobium TaxID=325217 RepID=UPI003336FBC7
MTAATTLARFSAVEGALASGFVTAELHHSAGHDPPCLRKCRATDTIVVFVGSATHCFALVSCCTPVQIIEQNSEEYSKAPKAQLA